MSMGRSLVFHVAGRPAPQGSKRYLGLKNGRGVMVDSSKYLAPWREAVKWAALEAAREAGWCVLLSTCQLEVVFHLARPKYHYRGGDPVKGLKPGMETLVGRPPDLSKLVRSTEDAITDAGVWGDDGQIGRAVVEKRWCAPGMEGADVIVTELVEPARHDVPPTGGDSQPLLIGGI